MKGSKMVSHADSTKNAGCVVLADPDLDTQYEDEIVLAPFGSRKQKGRVTSKTTFRATEGSDCPSVTCPTFTMLHVYSKVRIRRPVEHGMQGMQNTSAQQTTVVPTFSHLLDNAARHCSSRRWRSAWARRDGSTSRPMLSTAFSRWCPRTMLSGAKPGIRT